MLASTSAPLLLAALTNRHRRRERAEDYARQDAVARRAEAATKLITARQVETATQTAEAVDLILVANEQVALQVAAGAVEAQSQLAQIHTLVNSELAEAQRRELEATKTALDMMRQVVDLRREVGVEPSAGIEDAILELETRVEGMDAGLRVKETEADAADVERDRTEDKSL